MRSKGIALATAIGLGLFAATTASAAPINPAAASGQGLTASTVEQAQYKRGWNKRPGWQKHRGSRRDHARRHWRRYHARPSNWQSRGCIVIGPIWYCP
jgi:hypothetical protein